LNLREQATARRVTGDAAALAQALDNLVVNAIEHGGSRILIETRSTRSWLRIAVLDSGRGAGGGRSREHVIAGLMGRRRHGHGLNVVRRVVSQHSGRFSLRARPQGSAAVIELPLPRWDDDAA
jgi:signal transduction histidine kinase